LIETNIFFGEKNVMQANCFDETKCAAGKTQQKNAPQANFLNEF